MATITIRPDRKDELLNGIYGCRDGETRLGCAIAESMATYGHQVNLIVNDFKWGVHKPIDNITIYNTSELSNLNSDIYIDTHWNYWRGHTTSKITLFPLWSPIHIPYANDIKNKIQDTETIPIIIYPYPHIRQNFNELLDSITDIPFPYYNELTPPNFNNSILLYIDKNNNENEFKTWKNIAEQYSLSFKSIHLGTNWEERDKLEKSRLTVRTFLSLIRKSKLVVCNGYPSGIPIESIVNGTAVISNNNSLWNEQFDINCIDDMDIYSKWILKLQNKYNIYSFKNSVDKMESLMKTFKR